MKIDDVRNSHTDTAHILTHTYTDADGAQQVWQGYQRINYKFSNLSAAEGNASLAKKINLFFVRFEVDSSSSSSSSHPPVSSTHTLTVEEREVQVESGEPKESCRTRCRS